VTCDPFRYAKNGCKQGARPYGFAKKGFFLTDFEKAKKLEKSTRKMKGSGISKDLEPKTN
jgi:hypothetical protein